MMITKLMPVLILQGSHLTPQERASIVNLRKTGWTFGRISRSLGICISTAKRIHKEFKTEGRIEKKTRSKHHRVTSPEEDQAMAALIKICPNKTAREIKNELGLKAKIATVKLRLREIRGTKIIHPKQPGDKPPRKRKPKKPPVLQAATSTGQVAEESSLSRDYMVPQPSNVNNISNNINLNLYRPNNSFCMDFYKDIKDMGGYRVNNESYFQRDNKHSMNFYSNDSFMFPQMFQQFHQNHQLNHHPPHHPHHQ